MSEMPTYVPYITASIGAALGLVSFGYARVCELERRKEFFEFASGELAEALEAVDEVLSNDQTPHSVRKPLLLILKVLSSEELGRSFMESFVARLSAVEKPKNDHNAFAEALENLHSQNSELANLTHKAMMGLILSMPILYADRLEVSSLAREGATNPGSIWAGVANALSSLRGDDKFDNHSNGPHAAHA